MTPLNVRKFHSALLRWYQDFGRDLPWRRTTDPYAILVSEFMLQQTQVTSVLPYYQAWLRRFPDFRSLARASENDVLHGWQGLGYYSRARNLHAAAKIISKKYRGHCPRDVDELRALPGIGRYTANAVASFAFDQPVPVVEANIARVIARLFNFSAPVDTTAGRNALWAIAASLVPDRKAGALNSALMDLGAVVCAPHTPRCGICPVRKFCRAKDPAGLPMKKARPRSRNLSERHLFALKGDCLLMQKATERWRGMWVLPPLRVSPGSKRPLHRSIFSFTYHRIALKIFPPTRPVMSHPLQRWMKIASLNSIPIPSPHRRAIEDLLAQGPVSLN